MCGKSIILHWYPQALLPQALPARAGDRWPHDHPEPRDFPQQIYVFEGKTMDWVQSLNLGLGTLAVQHHKHHASNSTEIAGAQCRVCMFSLNVQDFQLLHYPTTTIKKSHCPCVIRCSSMKNCLISSRKSTNQTNVYLDQKKLKYHMMLVSDVGICKTFWLYL